MDFDSIQFQKYSHSLGVKFQRKRGDFTFSPHPCLSKRIAREGEFFKEAFSQFIEEWLLCFHRASLSSNQALNSCLVITLRDYNPV